MDAALKERVRARVQDIFAMELSDERARKLTELSDAFPQDVQVVEEIVKQESALALKSEEWLSSKASLKPHDLMDDAMEDRRQEYYRAVDAEHLRQMRIGSGYVHMVDSYPPPSDADDDTTIDLSGTPNIAKHEPPPTTKITRYEDSVQYVVAKEYPALADAIKARADEGFKKYGTYLGVNNGRDVKMDMVQETLDAMNYGMQGMLEGRSELSNPYKLAAIASMQLLGIAERDGEEKKEHFYKLSEFQVEMLLAEVSSPGRTLLFEGMRAWLSRRRGGE